MVPNLTVSAFKYGLKFMVNFISSETDMSLPSPNSLIKEPSKRTVSPRFNDPFTITDLNGCISSGTFKNLILS